VKPMQLLWLQRFCCFNCWDFWNNVQFLWWKYVTDDSRRL